MLSNASFFSDTFEATYMFICKLGLRFTRTICLFYKMLNLQKKKLNIILSSLQNSGEPFRRRHIPTGGNLRMAWKRLVRCCINLLQKTK